MIGLRDAKLILKPRNNQVVFEQFAPEEFSRGGVVIPDKAKENHLLATVVAIGPGKEIPINCRSAYTDANAAPYDALATDDAGLCRFEPIADLKVGDVIFFNIRHAVPIYPKAHDKDPLSRMGIVDADQILATVTMAPEEHPQPHHR